ncbi:MAG TPA: GDP-mannose 4,6-dehydratase [Ignavibacteria bacterium]|nr:GDP-mannose 4,6-dehydratase [Ignavibacteria bacterium]HMR38833.1 GDP-mannose 4,6-dehydratase [Ignavibacteria bacterium]
MDKYLITGFSGFVGKNFTKYINDNSYDSSVLGIDILNPSFNINELQNVKVKFIRSDLRDREKISKIIYDFSPNYILHLASSSSVAESWKSPVSSFQNNLNIFIDLLEDIRKIGINSRIISVGSSEEYGTVEVSRLPLKEDNKLNPTSPFGIARYSQELVGKLYSDVYGMDIVMTRSFNHIGPGQSDEFAISSFAKQIAEIKRNNQNEFLLAGDVSVIRDFIDVRDVVRAYRELFLKGKKGEVYNVCSGSGISLHNIIQIMSEILDIKIIICEDKKLKRPRENPVIIGSNEKIKSETGWENMIPLERSLKDILNYYIQKSISEKFVVYH